MQTSDRPPRPRRRNRLPRPLGRRARRRGGRGVLHDRVRGLRAGGHRPELRAPGARVRLSARRQLRRRRAAARVEPGLDGGRRHAPRPARVVGLARAARASSRSRRSTRARSCGGCATNGAMRCALGTAPPEELHARALARAAPRLAADARRARARLAPARARGLREPSRTRSAPGRASSCSTSAASARSSAGSSSRASRRSSSRAPGTRTRCSSSSPQRCWSATARAIRPSSTGRSRPSATCSAACRSSASASATSSSGSRSACSTFKLPFGHRGANHPVRVTGSRRVLVTAQNHGFAVEPGDARRGQPRLAQRRHRRGARGRRLRDAPVPSRGRARPARRPALLRPDRRRRAEAHRSSQHPDRRLRADPDRAGLRVRLRGRAGVPGAARARATGSCS